MGKGRAPCCDKSKVKRGPWSPCEDLRLIAFIQKHGHHNWRTLPKQAGLSRCGKSCRLRWMNYLRQDVKRGNFTKVEEDTIIRLHQALGNKWSKIASYLPGRTDNEIKNMWNTHLKKRLDRRSSDVVGNDQTGESQKESPSLTSLHSSSPISSASCVRKKNFKLDETKHSDIDHQEESSVATSHDEMDKLICKESMMLINCDMEDHHRQIDIWCDFVGTYIETRGFPEENKEYSLETPLDQCCETDMPFEFGRMRCETSGVIQEVINKSELVQVPLEPDNEFWNRLDGLGSFASGNVQRELQMCTYRSDFGWDHEYNEWFDFLDNQNYYDCSFLGEKEVD